MRVFLGSLQGVTRGIQSTRGQGKVTSSPIYMATGLQDIVADAISWAHLHGLVVGQGDGTADVSIIHAPFSLFPNPFPESEFNRVRSAMPLFSTLVHAVAKDHAYLHSVLAEAARYDPFTARQLALLASSRTGDGQEPPIALGLHRSDYMLDEPSGLLLQVELNTIAASFGSLSTRVGEMHRYLLSRYPAASPATLDQLPDQQALPGFAAAIAAAHSAWCKEHASTAARASAVIAVMVVQPGERNAYDQLWLQQLLWERHGVRMLRRSLCDIHKGARLDSAGCLLLEGSVVSVAYLRAGYTPDDYPSEAEWSARELLEQSTAVSCPSVAYQLAGAKKVQQDLSQPGRLERFMSGSSKASSLQSCFAGLWSLNDDEMDDAIVKDAIAQPDKYVLKPQREGGGNNVYGEGLANKLMEREGLGAYILMQRIMPPTQQSILVRKGVHRVGDTVSELGIYGAYLSVKGETVINEYCGYLLRTKVSSSDEGGVAAGFAVLDSPYLCAME